MATTNVNAMSDDDFEVMMNEALNDESSLAEDDLEVDNIDEQPEVDESYTDGTEEVSVDEGSTEDDEDEDESDDLEQPEDEGTEESNDDDTDGEDEVTEEDEDSKTDADATVEEDEQPADDEVTKTEPEEQVQLNRFRASGTEFEFTTAETIELAKMGIDYRKKTQAIAPWRKTISALEAEDISQDDLNLMIDVLKGDKGALTSILKRTGVDALDLDTEAEDTFRPNDYGKSTAELDIEEVTSSISDDKEYVITHNVISKQWDDSSRDALVANPKMIALLHDDVKSGVYDEVAPLATKLKLFGDGSKSDIEYYREAGAQYYAEKGRVAQAEATAKANADRIAEVKVATAARKVIKKSASKRKAAAPTKSKAGTKDLTDYLDMDGMSDDEFSTFMEKEVKKGK